MLGDEKTIMTRMRAVPRRWRLRAAHVGLWLVSYTLTMVLCEVVRPSVLPPFDMLLLLGIAFLAARFCIFELARGFRRLLAPSDPELLRVVGLLLSCAALACLMLRSVMPAELSPLFALIDGGMGIALVGLIAFVPELLRRTRAVLRRGAAYFGTRFGIRGDAPRLVLVGQAGPLCRALSAGREALGGRVSSLVMDGPNFSGTRLRRVRVIDLATFERNLIRRRIERVVLVPPLSTHMASWMEQRCQAAGVRCVRVGELAPSIAAVRATVAQSPDTLLERPAPECEAGDVRESMCDRRVDEVLGGKRVLIVGAGSPLGAAIALEVLRHGPGAVLLADAVETDLVECERSVSMRAACEVDARLLDLCDAGAVLRALRSLRPQVVIHAGSRRHLPLAERNPSETALANLYGLRTLIDALSSLGVESCLYVSSLAAVNPSSVLGATQRLGELYMGASAARAKSRLVTLRLPSLLGAAGTVLPIFLDEIERGLPLTITHPDAMRWFLTVPEAARLAVQAVGIGDSGDILIAGAGTPLSIGKLAERVVTRAGLRIGRDVSIQYIGLRPGERLREQMTHADETVSTSPHPAMFVLSSRAVPPAHLAEGLEALAEAALAGRDAEVVHVLSQLLPTYRPSREFTREVALSTVPEVAS